MFFLSTPLQARIANRLGIISLFRVGYKQKVKSKTFSIPIVENKEGLIYHLGVGEPFLLEVFEKLYSVKKFTFLDAGVNFGQTLLKVKAVAPDAPYIGFEPSGLCSYYGSVLIRANKLRNANLIRCALSDSPGVLTLLAQSEGDTRATILSNNIAENEIVCRELVPAITLDSLIPVISENGNDVILKVDVEGAELLVFRGGTELFNKFRPVVIFENLPATDAIKKKDQEDIGRLFQEQSYQLYLLDEENHRLTGISSIENSGDYSQTNYLAIPEEKLSWFPKLLG